jgi:glyoxylase-like metal-dependent hydrolase (beta-lactamase superfamily II)
MLRAPSQLVWRKRVLLDSIQKLLDYRFEWVLAGHGDRTRLPVDEMRAQLRALVERRQPSKVPS